MANNSVIEIIEALLEHAQDTVWEINSDFIYCCVCCKKEREHETDCALKLLIDSATEYLERYKKLPIHDVEVYYFGCWSGPGHFLHDINGRRCYELQTPWGLLHNLDGTLAPAVHNKSTGMVEKEAPQGAAALHNKNNWTALAFWDRSVDSRGGSNSVFLLKGEFDFEQTIKIAQERFPHIWERFSFQIRPLTPSEQAKYKD